MQDIQIYKSVEPVVESLISSLLYLISCHNEDGGWGAVKNRETDVFPTYLAIWAFHEAGLFDLEETETAIELFRAKRKQDGCWGARFVGESAIDPTVRGLISIFRPMHYQKRFRLQRRDKQALEYIAKSQNLNGSWSRDVSSRYSGSSVVKVYPQGDVGATLPIIDLYCMIPEKNRTEEIIIGLRNGAEWLASNANRDGGCGYIENDKSNVLATSWALRALCTYSNENASKDYEKFISYLLKKQRNNGSWDSERKRKGDILYSYNAVHSLILSGRSLADPDVQRGIIWLIQNQNEDGSWQPLSSKVGSIQYTASLILVLSRLLT